MSFLCPQGGLDLSSLKLVDDLAVRWASDKQTWSGFDKARAARFKISDLPYEKVATFFFFLSVCLCVCLSVCLQDQ
jgi:hypothetical protein